MIDKYTAQAPTKEAAIEKGLKALGLKKEAAEIEVTEPGKKGFLGIGQKDAVVVVKRKNTTNDAKSVLASSFLKEEILPKDKPTAEKELFIADEHPTDPMEEEAIVEPVAESSEEVKESQETTATESNNVVETEEPVAEETKPTISEEERQKIEKTDAAAIQQVTDYLTDVTKKMGIEDVTIHVEKQGKKVQYNIETEDAGLVIGRHGKVLNSLQTLAQIQLHQLADSKFFAKVDAEAYRDRRQKTVEQLAKRTADKVKQTNRPVTLEPMPAHERKLIHRYLNHHQGIQTHSEGKEPHRYLVVEPEE
ncbi:RNA-binding cell elongation regulator Jag/EloR [Marinilactibacillus kalidii]|uniref:RNA-binding cell elongation regulator Jag/EloR n=1 Tax=Marinilactibacillus kalidii TaxID=2820274 RepID=UPI001ABDCFF8